MILTGPLAAASMGIHGTCFYIYRRYVHRRSHRGSGRHKRDTNQTKRRTYWMYLCIFTQQEIDKPTSQIAKKVEKLHLFLAPPDLNQHEGPPAPEGSSIQFIFLILL